jgi:hypothetical protein
LQWFFSDNQQEMRILFLKWLLTVSLLFPGGHSQSPFRFYEEDYVSGMLVHSPIPSFISNVTFPALFIDNVKGRVTPPQPKADCINKVRHTPIFRILHT